MSRAGSTAPLAGGAGLLGRAVSYALGAAEGVTPDLLPGVTPCRGWDLRMLLRHASDSVAAVQEGIDAGRVGLQPPAGDSTTAHDQAADPAGVFRERAGWLLSAWAGAGSQQQVVGIADRCITLDVLAATGALEIAVHGWDISRACGNRQPMPCDLALELLILAPLLVSRESRPSLFAAPLAASPSAWPGDRLAAFLGRAPDA
jgi:uncharacterized protein (TIGR03086 family)